MYNGTIHWISPQIETKSDELECSIEKGIISEAIVKEGLIKMDWTDYGDGLIILVSTDGIKFKGLAKYTDGNTDIPKIDAELFRNSNGYLLIGQWIEYGYQYSFICKVVVHNSPLLKFKLF